MLVQFTVMDGRGVGTASREVSGSAAEVEEQIRQVHQRAGRMALEPGLLQIVDQTSTPHCCQRSLQNRDRRVLPVRTTFGEIPVSRREYRCEGCNCCRSPADAAFCCGRHRVSEHVWDAAKLLAPDDPEAWGRPALDRLWSFGRE